MSFTCSGLSVPVHACTQESPQLYSCGGLVTPQTPSSPSQFFFKIKSMPQAGSLERLRGNPPSGALLLRPVHRRTGKHPFWAFPRPLADRNGLYHNGRLCGRHPWPSPRPEIRKDFRGKYLHIVIENPDRKECGCERLILNGRGLDYNHIPADLLENENEICLIL